MLERIKKAVFRVYKRKGTVYKLFWTGLQAGAGVAAAAVSGNPTYGVIVGALAVVITSEARKHLDEVKVKAEA